MSENDLAVQNNYPMDNIPNFSKDVSIDMVKNLIPVGFSHLVSSSYNQDTNSLDLTFSRAELGKENVRIPARLFAPSSNRNIYPMFLLEISSYMPSFFNYSNQPECYLNQNQMLYLIILHRLIQYDGNNTSYVHLLQKDISALVNYGEYDSYSSYNAKKKSENYIAIVSPWSPTRILIEGKERVDFIIKEPIGEYISTIYRRVKLNTQMLSSIFRDLPIQPASESMAAENAKFVIAPHDSMFYKCAGYTTFNDSKDGYSYPAIRTIYPRKPNLPARIKTHIIADCYDFENYDLPIFTEDLYGDNNSESDKTFKNAFVVFDEMNPDTGRLVCGEILASKTFSDNIIEKDEVIRKCFKDIKVKEGEYVQREGNKFILGIDEDDEVIALYNFEFVKIISIEESGQGDSYKIIASCSKRIGSAKALSTTGLKGMTKPKPNLGEVLILNEDSEYILNEDGEAISYQVDLVAGMNSVKAKSNTIFLARAALAVDLDISNNPLISSMDADEINMESAKIGQCLYRDENGNERLVWCGIVQVRVNELSYMFNNVKPQKFMAESGRYLRNGGYESVFEKIWELGVDPDMKDAVLELQKILVDDTGYYATIDGLNVYTYNDLLYGVGPDKIRIFELEDCQFNMKPIEPYSSKMLNEDYNKGWYLDMRGQNPKLGVTRMPSAKLLNLLTRELPDGRWSYPVIFDYVSRIIKICLTIKEDKTYGDRELGLLANKHSGDRTERPGKYNIAKYLNLIHGMIYKKVDFSLSHTKMIDVFMKPQILGVGMKQVTDEAIPQGTAVIFDKRTYNKLSVKTGGFHEKKNYFNALCIRNPVLWISQVQSYKIINGDTFDMGLLINHDKSRAEYLVEEYGGEIFFINPVDALIQQSDVDGDLMPVFVVDDYDSQCKIEEIRTKIFEGGSCGGLNGILKEEIEWLNEYHMGELESNKDLDLTGKKYELYTIPFRSSPVDSEPSFLDYFQNSIIAKTEVGTATIQLWTVNTLLEIYKYMCDSGQIINHKGKKMSMPTESCQYIVYAYTRMIQDFVVRGIKHVEGGSSAFEPFKLDNISSKMSVSSRAYFRNTINMSRNALRDFEMMLHWMKDKGYLESVQKYISMFNSGRAIEDGNPEHMKMIEDHSFYGYLLREFREVKVRMDSGFQDITNESSTKDVDTIINNKKSNSGDIMDLFG